VVLGRFIGWLLLGAAVVALGADALASLEAGNIHLEPLGAVWFKIDVGSLNLTQAVIQRYVSPWLWDPAIQWLLAQPAAAVAGVPAVVLLWFFRAPASRRPRRRSSAFE